MAWRPLDEKTWWALKIVTLLHDIPWKPWLISGGYGGERPARDLLDPETKKVYYELLNTIKSKHGKLEANDEEAIALILYIFSGLDQAIRDIIYATIEEYWGMVHEADVRASSADRLLTPRVRPVEPGKLVNIFRPELTIVVDKPPLRKVGEYILSLKSVVEKAAKGAGSVEEALKKIYFALYVLMETNWYRTAGYRSMPPADTRIPHHTVFHHLCASVAMSNTIGCWALVLVDTPGIQGFVRQGRKTRDFWAGSWLVSFLTWKAVEPFVNAFGPDVVLSPALFLNPFYLDMVLGLKAVDKADLPYIAWGSGWPEQPVVPGTMMLIIPLPCEKERQGYIHQAWSKLISELATGGSECDLEGVRRGNQDALEKCVKAITGASVVNVWRRILKNIVSYKIISDLVNKTCEEADPGKQRECSILLEKYLQSIRERPPLTHRIATVIISENSLEKSMKDIIDKLKREGLSQYINILGEFARRELGVSSERLEDVLTSIFTNTYRIPYAMKKLSERLNSIPLVSFDPGVLVSDNIREFTERIYRDRVLPRFRVCSLCGKMPAVVYLPRDADPGRFDYILDEGEGLCPYCLVKRVLGKKPRLALSGALNTEPGERAIISTYDLANVWNIKIAEKLPEESSVGYELRIKPYRVLSEVADGDLLKKLIAIDAMLSRSGLDVVAESDKSIAEMSKDYVAFVIGDGDNLGKGYWRGMLPKPSNYDYYENVVKMKLNASSLKDRLWEMTVLNAVYLYRVLMSSGVSKSLDEQTLVDWLQAYGALAYIGKVAKLVDLEASVLVTPSYVYTLSHSLLVSSLIDSLIVDALGGVLIYAGGDDIAAVVPVYGSIGDIGRKRVVLPLYTLSLVFSKLLPKDLYKEQSRLDHFALYEAIVKEIFGSFSKILAEGKADNVPVPLLAVAATRMNYWGSLLSFFGLNVRGFHVYDGIVSPATAAYGRSYGLFVAHQKDPLWIAYSMAAGLEKLKEHVVTVGSSRIAVEKDFLIATYGRVRGYVRLEDLIADEGAISSQVELSVIPLSLSEFSDATALLKSALRIYLCLNAGKLCSKSLVYSISDTSTLRLLVNVFRESVEDARRLAEYLIERHVSESVRGIVINDLLDSGVGAYKIRIMVRPGESTGMSSPMPLIVFMVALLKYMLAGG